MGDRLTSAENLKPGDVCLVAVELRDKSTGQPYWWKRFVCVLDAQRRQAIMLTLKMQIDTEKDLRVVDFGKDVVTQLSEAEWPQGVIAMRMKWIMKGLIKVDGDD